MVINCYLRDKKMNIMKTVQRVKKLKQFKIEPFKLFELLNQSRPVAKHKKKIFAFLTCTLLVLLSQSAVAQSNNFGKECIGTWKGTMHMYSQGRLRDSISVVLEVAQQNDSVFKWKMDYLSEKMPLTKDYRLIYKGRNHYQTDEGDGIMLDGYLFGKRLISVFETGGILLTSAYELRKDELYFEVTSSNKEKSDSDPEVQSYQVGFLQNVLFKRVSK